MRAALGPGEALKEGVFWGRTQVHSGAWRHVRRASPMNLKFEMIRLVVQKKINNSASKTIINFLIRKDYYE